MRVALVLGLLLVLSSPVMAEPPAPMDDRVKILEVEMRRGPAEALRPFLVEGAHPLSRWYAIRALGRIGERGEAPAMLAELLETGAEPLASTLWAAGIAQTDKLYEPIQKHLKSEKPEIVAAAAEALGWTKKGDAINDLSPLLGHKDARVRYGALMGLARLRPEGLLERVAPFVHDKDADVQRAAGFTCWMIAGARARAAKALDKDWDGNFSVAEVFLPLLKDPVPDRRMDGLRALSGLLYQDLSLENLDEIVGALADDPDPRVVQDTIWRLLRTRKGEVTDVFLAKALEHVDPKVRQMAAETVGQQNHDTYVEPKDVLAAALAKEQDPRVKEALVLELARLGDAQPWREWAESSARSETVEKAARQLTDVRVRLLSKDEEALAKLLRLAEPSATGQGLHPAAMMELLSGLEENEDPRIGAWLAKLLPGGGPFDVGDVYVASSAIGLIATNKYWKRFAELKQTCSYEQRDLLHDEIRLALAGAFGDFGADEKCSAADKSWIEDWLRRAMYGDASAWVRAKAKASLEQIGVAGLPEEDVLPPTDWKGLPRPASPVVLGVDLSKGAGEWLSEREVLRLADALIQIQPRIRFETTQGAFEVTLDPEAAPVHSVSALLAVHAGVYNGTRWHRVVPNFVIQGGDPHGHGAGNAGWFVPDEITRRSYVRGALGMPKSRKDDGGCQLFFMHTRYIPLDERYTCYGEVVSGMDTVDKIRVGDTITKATIVTK